MTKYVACRNHARVLKTAVLGAFAAVASAGYADDAVVTNNYYWKGSTTGFNTASSKTQRWYNTKDGVTLKAMDVAGVYWSKTSSDIPRTMANSTHRTFEGMRLNLGSPANPPADWDVANNGTWFGANEGWCGSYSYGSSYKFTVNDLVWWNGGIAYTYKDTDKDCSGEISYYVGTWTIRQADDGVVHTFKENYPLSSMTIQTTFKSCADDGDAARQAVITFKAGTRTPTFEQMLAGATWQFRLSGDFSQYDGSFNVETPYLSTVIYNATSLGNTNIANTAAITLQNNAAFAIGSTFKQDVRRGITLAGDQAYFMTWVSRANAYKVSYPITKAAGAAGKLIIRGPGTVTLDGAYSAGDIVVESGTLAITANATFPEGQKITVNEGATIKTEREDLQFDGDGTWARTIEFDGTNTTAVTLPIGSETLLQSFALSQKITFPQNDGLKLPIYTYAGTQTLTTNQFCDTTGKSYELPHTWLTIEQEDSVQKVYLNVKPVIISTANIVKNAASTAYLNLNGEARHWSDNLVPHSGADYILQHQINSVNDSSVFGGDSLTILGLSSSPESRLILMRNSPKFPTNFTTRVYDKAILTQGDYCKATIKGDLELPGTYGDSLALTIRQKYGLSDKFKAGDWRLFYTGRLSGARKLAVTQYQYKRPDYDMGVGLFGDNSQFFGKIEAFGCSNNTTEDRTFFLYINSAKSLGGELASFKYDALTMYNNAYLTPTNVTNLTVANDKNRGLYLSGDAGFSCNAGQTLRWMRPIRAAGDIYKRGAGNVILGGAMTFGADGKGEAKTIYVRNGGVGIMNDEAASSVNTVFSNGTAVVIASDSTCVNGFTGAMTILPDENGEAKIRVVPATGFEIERGATVSFPICTVPTAGMSLTKDSFAAVRASKATAMIESEEVTVNDVACTRFKVTYRRHGMLVIVN